MIAARHATPTLRLVVDDERVGDHGPTDGWNPAPDLDDDCEHVATIEFLEFEIDQLREAVAHLHASPTPLPAHLRVIVARAIWAREGKDVRV
jgi:hypothetical protein